jgi:hypothetical protein
MDEYSIEDGNILVKPKHNKELLEGVANLQNNELDDIVRMFYKHGATYAMKSSAVIKIFQDFVKPSNIKNIIKEYKGEGQLALSMQLLQWQPRAAPQPQGLLLPPPHPTPPPHTTQAATAAPAPFQRARTSFGRVRSRGIPNRAASAAPAKQFQKRAR